MLDLNALAPVSPQEFSASEDLPIRQVLRRFGERRLGEAQESNALTGTQERLALYLEARARRSEQPLTFFGTGQSGRRGLHLDVGARYLPLKVDVGFGRYGDFQVQSLFPTGGGQYRLDAALLKLWIEEEIQAMERPWVEAQLEATQAAPQRARALPSPDRAASRPQPQAPSVAASLPPAVKDALEPRRQELRRAMLQAVQGDVRELARLTHGAQVQAILQRLQARAESQPQGAGRAPSPAALLDGAQARVGAEVLAGEQAPLGAATALRMEDLAQLRPFLPTLSVDAADPAFTFEGAAESVMQRARGLAAQAMRGDALGHPELKANAPMGSHAHEASRFAQQKELARARMFGVGAAEVQAVEAVARAMTPFAHSAHAPHLPALQTSEGLGRSALGAQGRAAQLGGEPSLSASIAAALEPSEAPRRPLGELGLKALELRSAAPKERAARRWLMEGGRGVLLDGLDGAGPQRKAPAPAVAAQPWELAAQPEPSVVPPAPARGLAAVLEALTPASLASTTSYPAGVAARAAAGVWSPEMALATAEPRVGAAVSALARRGAEPTLGAALAGSYDATARGDFASVVARAQLLPWASAPQAATQAAARLEARLLGQDERRSPALLLGAAQVSPLAQEGSQPLVGRAPSLGQALGLEAARGGALGAGWDGPAALGAAPAEVQLEDIAISSRYMPSLARALEQLGRAGERAARLLPGMATGAAFAEGLGASPGLALGREVGALGRLHEALRAVRAGLQDAQVLPGRLAELATRFAELVREGQEAGLRGPAEPRRGYQAGASGRWGQELTALRMEALAPSQPKQAGGEAWSAQAAAQFVSQVQAQVQARAVEQVERLSQVAPQLQARQEAPRALALFSPEKALSMLAPQLESGGLLDATSRRELSAALQALSAEPSAAGARRVRTPFGTLSIRVAHGQVVVDAEEVSSLSPSVSVSRAAAVGAQVATAPTRQTEALAALAAPATLAQAGAVRGSAGLLASLGRAGELGALARQALGAVEGVELLLGGPGRAERGAGVVLEPLAGRAAEGLAGAVAARGAEALGAQPQAARAAVRHERAGEVIRVHAGSQRAAEVLQALRRRGFVVSEDGRGVAQVELGGAAQGDLVAAAQAGLGDAARVSAGGRLAELLARPEVARAADPRLSGEGQPAAVEAAGQRPLERLLAEAADARAIGALGKVGMARPAFGALTRADLAHVLPYLQREAVGARGEPLALAAEQVGGASELSPSLGAGLEAALRRAGTTPEALSRALGLTSAAELPQVAQRMGLSGVGVGAAPEVSQALKAVGRPIGGSEAVGALGERLAAGSAGSSAWSRVQAPEATLVQAQGRVEAEQARLDRISRRLEARPRQPLQAQALSGVMLRELSGVRELVEQLGGPQPQRLKARLEAAGLAGRGAERGELVQVAGLRGLATGGERAGAEANLESRAGRVGIWMPLGVERLVAEGAEALVGAQGGFEGAFVAPRLFQAASAQRMGGGARGSSAGAGGRAPWREVGGRMGLGLVDLKASSVPSAAGGSWGAEGVGELPAIGAGGSPLNQAPWMTSTQALSRMEQLVSALQQGSAAQQATRRGGVGGELTLPSLPASPDAVVSARAGAAGGGYAELPQPPRELYKPPYSAAPQAMPSGQGQGGQAGPSVGAWGQPVGQQGFATPRASMDQQNAPEVRPERGGEHPYDAGEMPTQQHIEDLAQEVLETLKRKWAYELERRGVE